MTLIVNIFINVGYCAHPPTVLLYIIYDYTISTPTYFIITSSVTPMLPISLSLCSLCTAIRFPHIRCPDRNSRQSNYRLFLSVFRKQYYYRYNEPRRKAWKIVSIAKRENTFRLVFSKQITWATCRKNLFLKPKFYVFRIFFQGKNNIFRTCIMICFKLFILSRKIIQSSCRDIF